MLLRKEFGLLVNRRGKENLPTKDKIPAPNVSVIQGFHCMCSGTKSHVHYDGERYRTFYLH